MSRGLGDVYKRQEEYDLEIPTEDLEKLTTVGEVAAYIQEHKE